MANFRRTRVPIRLASGKMTTGIRNKRSTPSSAGLAGLPPSKVDVPGTKTKAARLAQLQEIAVAHSKRANAAAALLRSNALSLYSTGANPHRIPILASDISEVTDLLDGLGTENAELTAAFNEETADLPDRTAGPLVAASGLVDSQRLAAATAAAVKAITHALSRNTDADAGARAEAFAAAAAVEQIRGAGQERRARTAMNRGDESAAVDPIDDLVNSEHGSAVMARKFRNYAMAEAHRADIQAGIEKGPSAAWSAVNKASNHSGLAEKRARVINALGNRR